MTDDIMDKLPDEELPEEEHEALLLMCGHGFGPPLSPAAQAVMNAYRDAPLDDEVTAAAVIRAAADQLGYCLDGSSYFVVAKTDLHAIAAELEALSNV